MTQHTYKKNLIRSKKADSDWNQSLIKKHVDEWDKFKTWWIENIETKYREYLLCFEVKEKTERGEIREYMEPLAPYAYDLRLDIYKYFEYQIDNPPMNNNNWEEFHDWKFYDWREYYEVNFKIWKTENRMMYDHVYKMIESIEQKAKEMEKQRILDIIATHYGNKACWCNQTDEGPCPECQERRKDFDELLEQIK